MSNETDKDRIYVFNPDREQSARIKKMNNMNFTNNPFKSLILGVDDDKMEDIDLHEVIDRVVRKSVARGKDDSEEDIEKKFARAKKRIATFISEMGDNEGSGSNLGALFFALLFGGSGNLVANGFRSVFTDKDGNEMPEDVFKNEYMPLVQKAAKINELMTKVEALTEENSCSITAPSIVASIYYSKEELLELLKGHKAYLDSEMKKIIAPYAQKEDK